MILTISSNVFHWGLRLLSRQQHPMNSQAKVFCHSVIQFTIFKNARATIQMTKAILHITTIVKMLKINRILPVDVFISHLVTKSFGHHVVQVFLNIFFE